MPSVSQAIAWMPGAPSSASASPSRNSRLRPPLPWPRTVTVVSPPESSRQGGGKGAPNARAWSAMPAMTLPASRASPSIRSESSQAGGPPSAASSRHSRGVAIRRNSERSSAFGVSPRPPSGAIPLAASTRRASASVVGSGTVGPDAMVAGSSPGTSEIASVTVRAGKAAAASRPPFTADMCLRTVLISWIEAPEASRRAVTACLASKDMPGSGRASSAEPPPEARNRKRSSGPSARAASRIRPAAARPAASGTGWPASTTSIREQGTPCL